MERHRNLAYSIYYFIKERLHRKGFNTIREYDQTNLYRVEVPTYVGVFYDFDDVELDDTTLPTIVLTHNTTANRPLQIGGGWWSQDSFYVDVFAKNNTERDELSCILHESFNDYTINLNDYSLGNWPEFVYNSGEGFLETHYPSGAPTVPSDIYFRNVSMDTLPRVGTIGEVDNHRSLISLVAISRR